MGPLSLKWFRTSLESKPAGAQTGALASEVCVVLAVPSLGGQGMWQDGWLQVNMSFDLAAP